MDKIITFALVMLSMAVYSSTPISTAVVNGVSFDTTVATNDTITLGRNELSIQFFYSSSMWNTYDPSEGVARITVDDESVFETEASEGIFNWTPSCAGRYRVALTVGSVTCNKIVRFIAPTVGFAREGYSSCKLTASDGVSPIRYTTDGSDPTESSTLYTGPFEISLLQWTTVKARTFGEGYLPGEICSEMFGKAGSTVSRAETAVVIDNRSGVRNVPCEVHALKYDVTWEGDDSSRVTLSADGEKFAERTGSGEIEWMPTREGLTTLLLKTLNESGTLEGEYTATFYVWPSEIVVTNGVLPLKEQLTGGIESVRSVIVSEDVSELCADFFEGCSGLKSVTLPLAIFEGNKEQAPQIEKNNWIEGEDGVYQSNDINDSESTSMTLEVEGPCDFTFDWKVSSEGYCDNLKWYLDGSQISEISGTGSDWQTVRYSIPEGSHTIRWEYSKDGSVCNGDDCGWVRFTELVSTSVTMANLFPDSYMAITNVVLTGEGEKIPAGAFAGCASLQNVEISESVTHIGTGAFNGCVAMADDEGFLVIRDVLYGYFGDGDCVVIPDGVVAIDVKTFYGYDNLTEVIIPSTVRRIGAEAFANCASLERVVIPSSVTDIGNNAFAGCNSIKDATLPGWGCGINLDNVTKLVIAGGTTNIGNYEFQSCYSLESVTMPNSVTNIGYGAFSYCSNLKRVEIPDSVIAIGSYSFESCNSELYDTTSIPGIKLVDGWAIEVDKSKLPAELDLTGIRGIDGSVFQYCTSIERVTMPKSFISVNDWMFFNCSSLKSVTIHDGVKNIGYAAFCGCSSLSDIIIPNSVTNIAEGAFSGCSSLTNMVLPFVGAKRGNFGTRESVLGYVFGADVFDKGTSVKQYFGDGDEYTAVYCIPNSLKSVSLTDEELLGWGAFYGCKMLSEVVLNEGIYKIDSYSFRNCYGLGNLGIPESVEIINSNAFRGSGIANVTLPSGLRSLEFGLFKECRSLTDVVIPESVVEIKGSAFNACYSLASVTVPNSVTNIAEGAFSGCSSLTNMVLPFIGAARQSALPLYTTKASFGYIFGKNSYEGGVATAQEWTNGVSVTYYIPASLSSVTILDETETGGNAFRNCGNLKTVILNEGLRRIRGSTFYNCKSLTEVYIPETVETIIASAFYGCRNLEQIFIPASVVDIGSSAFRDCPALTTVLFEGDAPTVGGSCFYGVNASCVAKVSAKTSGWHADGEGRWNGLILEYVETEQDISDEVSKFADSKLAGYIKDAKSYAAFLSWVEGLDRASAEKVKSSPNTWLSYALDASELIEGEISEERLKVSSFDQMEDGTFSVKLKLDEVEVGDNAEVGNLVRTFAIEGTKSLEEAAFSVTNVAVDVVQPEEGAVIFGVSPREDVESFFFRARMRGEGYGIGMNGCAVSFDLGEGGIFPDGVSSQIHVPYTMEYGKLPVPILAGHRFIGWFTNPAGGVQVKETSKLGFESSKTLYARWQKTHEKVQLWEGGPYWATTNIGAEEPWESGYYFWWGDTVGYKREGNKWVASDGSNSNFSFSSGNTPTYGKYNSTLQSEGWITADGVLSPEHDAAQKHWGGDWRMPTEQEFDDLNSKCDWTWGSMNGVNGYVVRGRGDYSSASIFLPCAGYGFGTSLYLAGAGGSYWSSVPRSDYGSAWGLGIDSGIHGTDGSSSLNGHPVRPLQGVSCVAVTFDACGGSSVDSISIPLGQAIGELPVPTRNGYTFVGWFTAASGGMQVTANITVSVSMTTLYAQWQKTHEKVQLWEGGPYWATTNIGAENPEDYGYYFWWGDTVGYKREGNKWVASDGSNSNFSFSSGNTPTYGKYNSTLQSEGWITADGVLSPEHDAAQKHWGGDWRMPTEQEFDDLNSKCDWTWGSMNGVNGYVVRGRGDYSSASIFLPCAGCVFDTSLNLAGAGGFYWSSVPRSDYGSAWGLGIDSGIHGTDGSSRPNGQSVRPLQGFTK